MQKTKKMHGVSKAIGLLCAVVMLACALYVPMVMSVGAIASVEITDNTPVVFDFEDTVRDDAANKAEALGDAGIGYYGWGANVKTYTNADGSKNTVLSVDKAAENQPWATSGGYRLHTKKEDGSYGFYELQPATKYVVSFKIRVMASPYTISGSSATAKTTVSMGYNTSYDPNLSGSGGNYVNGIKNSIPVIESVIDSDTYTLFDGDGKSVTYECSDEWRDVRYFITTPAQFTADPALAFWAVEYTGIQCEIDDVSVTKIGADSGMVILVDEYSGSEELLFGKIGTAVTLPDISDRAQSAEHAFEGWYIDVDRTEKAENVTFTNATQTIYSRWKAPVSITFKDALNNTEKTITGSAGDKFSYPADPVDPSNESWFMGWYTDEGCTNEHTSGEFGYANMTLYAYFKGKIPGLVVDFEDYNIDAYKVNRNENGQAYKSNYLIFGATLSKQSDVTYNNSNYAVKFAWNPVPINDKDNEHYYDTARYRAKDNYFQLGRGLEEGQMYVVTFKYKAEKVNAPVNFYMVTSISNNAWASRAEYTGIDNFAIKQSDEWQEASFYFTPAYNGGADYVHLGVSLTQNEETVIYFDDVKIEAFAQPYESVVHLHTNIDKEVISIKGVRGEEIEFPVIEHPMGSEFKGWYTDSEFANPLEITTFQRGEIDVYAKWLEYSGFVQGFENYTQDAWTPMNVTKDNGTPDDKSDDFNSVYKSNYLYFYTTLSKQGDVVHGGNNAIKFHWNTDPSTEKDVSKPDGKNINNPESYEHKRYASWDNYFPIGKDLQNNQVYTVTFNYKVEKGDQNVQFYLLTANGNNAWGNRTIYSMPETVDLKPGDWQEYTFEFTTAMKSSSDHLFLGVVLSENEDAIIYFDDITVKSVLNSEEVYIFVNNGYEAETIRHVGIKGEKINLPEFDHPDDAPFIGWFTDPTFTTPFTLTEYPQENISIYAKWLARTGFTQDFENYTRDKWEPTTVNKDNGTPDKTSDDYPSIYKSNYLDFYTTMSKQSDVVYGGNYAIKFHWNTDPSTDKDVSKPNGKNINNPESYEHKRYSAMDNYFNVGKGLENNQVYNVTFKYKVEKGSQDVQFYLLTATGGNGWGGRKTYTAPSTVTLKPGGWQEYTFEFTTNMTSASDHLYLGVQLSKNEDVIMYFDDVKVRSAVNVDQVIFFINNGYQNEAIRHIGQKGETIKLPELNHPDNAEFLGWYTDAAFTTPFTLTEYPQTSLSLYAKWGPYAMTFRTYPYEGHNYTDPFIKRETAKGLGNGDDHAMHWNLKRVKDNDTGVGTSQCFQIYSGLKDGGIYKIKYDYKVSSACSIDGSIEVMSADVANIWWTGIRTIYQAGSVKVKTGVAQGWGTKEFYINANVLESGGYQKAEDLFIYFNFNGTGKAGARMDILIDNVYVEKIEAPYVYFDPVNGKSGTMRQGKAGDAVELPKNPEKIGYAFAGWYLDEECTQKFNLKTFAADTAVTAFAKWNESNSATYSFENYTLTPGSLVLTGADSVKRNAKSGDYSLCVDRTDADADRPSRYFFAIEDSGEFYNLENGRQYIITVNYFIKEYGQSNLNMSWQASYGNNIWISLNAKNGTLGVNQPITLAEARLNKGKWAKKTFAIDTSALAENKLVYPQLFAYMTGGDGWEIYFDDITITKVAKGQSVVVFDTMGAKGCPDYVIGKPGTNYSAKVPEILTYGDMYFKGYFNMSVDGAWLAKERSAMSIGEKAEVLYGRFLDRYVEEDFEDDFYYKANGKGVGYTIHDFDYEVYDSEKEGNSKDNVTSGRYSLHRKGNSMYNENSVVLTLGNQIAEGERYRVTFKVKLGKHFHTDGAVKIVSGRSYEYAWTTTGDYYAVAPIADLTDGAWHEVSYVFNSVEAFLVVQTPGYVEVFMDDFKFELVDENTPLSEPPIYTEYVAAERDANGNLLKKDRTAVDISTIIDASLTEGGFPWLWVIIGAAVVIVLAGGAVAFILIKKKKSQKV